MNKRSTGMIVIALILMNTFAMSFSTIMASPEIQSLVTDGFRTMTSLVIGVDKTKPNAYGRMRDLAIENGGKVLNKVSIEGEVIALVVELPLTVASSLAAGMKAAGLATYVEPRRPVEALFVPNDANWTAQWGPEAIEADWAWNYTKGIADITVAVVDTGVDWNHPDLAANYDPLGHDWINMDDDPMDDNGHGTHCAGIIAAVLNNSIGIAGIAQVRLMAEKVLNSSGAGWWDQAADGIINATKAGADIISMSFGSTIPDETVYIAIQYAYSNGVLLVASAGNSATILRSYPAAYDEVIAVAATDQNNNSATWSNFGNWVEFAAPGQQIYSTYWDDTYENMSGTSMAGPHVAGVAALIWSRYPNLTRDSVRYWLRYTADDLGLTGFDPFYGFGRINAHTAVRTIPPDYDLVALGLDVPLSVQAETSRVVRGTVLNLGNECLDSVEVQLLENGVSVDNATVSHLPSGNSSVINFSWTPISGDYNLTLYVVPKDEEPLPARVNNSKGKNVTARFPTILNVPSNYSGIQAAVHEAISGDTINVSAGTYNEVILIDKANVKLLGEASSSTTIQGRPRASVINVDANNITIAGFSIRGTREIVGNDVIYSRSSIEINGFSGVNISLSSIEKASCGIGISSSNDVVIEDTYIKNNEISGIVILSSNDVVIEDNYIEKNKRCGISAYNLNTSVIRGNTIAEHTIDVDLIGAWGGGPDFLGLSFKESFENYIADNNVLHNGLGFYLRSLHNSVISDNNISNNQAQGIYIKGTNNTFNGNAVMDNGWEVPGAEEQHFPEFGIFLDHAHNSTMRNNLIVNNTKNLWVIGDSLEHFVQDIDSSNTINHKPIYYWVNRQDEQFPWWRVGYIALVNCSNITVTDLMLSMNNYQGILLAYTMNSLIMNNEMTGNVHGIDLINSSANILAGNNIVANDNYGVHLRDSSNNEIFHNTFSQSTWGLWDDNSSNNKISHNSFINNDNHASSSESMNVWDSGYPLGGNYWDDYNGNDTLSGPNQDQPGSDGIGDTPYIIGDDNQDRYPFMYGVTHDLERDVAITSLMTNATHVTPGRTVQISVEVQNQGHHFNETFNVTAYAYNTTQDLNYTVGTQNVTALAPLSNETLVFNWNTTSATQNITYTIKAEADVVPDETDTADNTYIDGTVLVRLNDPPLDPLRPDGEQTGYAGWTYTYNTTTTDPNDGDQIWYLFDWGDDENTTVGPYDSGVEAEASHFWQYPETYNVTVKAKDYFDAWSDWSPPLVVTMTTQPGGGCPFVHVWNGTHYVIDNNLLPRSAWSNGTEVEDYYRLEQNMVPVYEGSYYSYYSLLISEFQQEHSFFDQVQLYAVDHEASVNVAVSPTGEVLTYQNPYAPLSAVDEQGTSWLEELNDIDDSYYEGYNGSYLLLDFGDLNVSEGAKLVIRADPPHKYSIHVQVLDSAQNWNDVATVIPRALWSTDIVGLSSYLPDPNGELKVRLYFTDSHKVDFVGLDTSPQAQIDIEQALLLLAYHSDDGVVTAELRSDDDVYAELTPEQQITLLFGANKQSGDQRTFIIYVKGYYYTITS